MKIGDPNGNVLAQHGFREIKKFDPLNQGYSRICSCTLRSLWMGNKHSQNLWARYADDAVIHCQINKEAEQLLNKLKERFKQCKLELHPKKTKIVSCKDKDQVKKYSVTEFEILGTPYGRCSSRTDWGDALQFPAISEWEVRQSIQRQG